ncbi:LacI family DNA-binding transcriptional regulator [Cryptosporangium phraense]|uniref:LacI family transcriptional regulator n=1 Tax=Cryptosporangium phraense TaxID=2593070 RepID=A0A545ANT6_9ACTN|nr:LacI family DNA-binding transcriptional regulator [Cryptosporangium phraense]TQS42977.1 LacI family transcriptional regulator [Cryptosporangium phraense]
MTIHDVARVAGVSHQTVSNVLNGRNRVGAAARQRVHAAIDELGYRRHAGAASLRTRRAGRLAYPLGPAERGPSNTILLEYLQALTAAAARHGQHLVLTEDDPAGALRLVRAGEVDGVVLTNVVAGDPRVTVLAAAGVPFACFGRTGPDRPQCWVDVDNQAGTVAITERLVARGHRRIAFLGYAPQGGWDVEREAGYRAAMGSARLTPRVSTPDPEGPQAARAIARLLDGARRPTAVVTGSDVLAAAVCAAATLRGLELTAAPAEAGALAVTGFDGSVVGRLLAPALTTVAIPLAEIAERVIRRVLAEIDGPTDGPGEVLAPEILAGATG